MPDCGPICLPGCFAVRGVASARAPCDCRGCDTADVAIGLDPERPDLGNARCGSKAATLGQCHSPHMASRLLRWLPRCGYRPLSADGRKQKCRRVCVPFLMGRPASPERVHEPLDNLLVDGRDTRASPRRSSRAASFRRSLARAGKAYSTTSLSRSGKLVNIPSTPQSISRRISAWSLMV